MELRQLKYFVTLARTLNFSEAARLLFITQGTLSQQIRQLEDETGQVLFERSSRKVSLTPAGETLLPLALKTIEDADQCAQKMHDIGRELRGNLRIGVSFCFDQYIVATIKEFTRLHPKVKLSIFKRQASDLINMLRNDEIDIALAFKPADNCDDLSVEELFSTSPMAIMRYNHPLAMKDSVCIDDLKTCGLIIPGTSLRARYSLEKFVKVDMSSFDIRMEIDDAELLVDVARATGIVAAVVPIGLNWLRMEGNINERDSVRNDPRYLIARPIEGLTTKMSCCVHTLKRSLSKASREAFIDILRDNVKYCL